MKTGTYNIQMVLTNNEKMIKQNLFFSKIDTYC